MATQPFKIWGQVPPESCGKPLPRCKWHNLDQTGWTAKNSALLTRKPENYHKMALLEAYNHQLGGGGPQCRSKTYIRISSSYYWPKLWTDILKHTNICLRWKQKSQLTNCLLYTHFQILQGQTSEFMQIFLGQCLQPDVNTNTYCAITDAFTKNVLITAVENKEAKTVTKAIFSYWFCKFSIPAQNHTDGGEEVC